MVNRNSASISHSTTGIFAQRQQRAERVGAADVERPARVLAQALGQHEQAEQEVGEGERRGGIERHAGAELAQLAADHRADDEAEPEGGADQPEALGALCGRGDVGHVGGGRRDRGAGNAGDERGR